MQRVSWPKFLIITSVFAGGLVLFDLQIAPILKNLARQVKSQVAKAPPPARIVPVEFKTGETASMPASTQVLTDRALLSVKSTPAGAAVSINGKEVGTTPWQGETPVGQDVLVSLHLEGFETAERALKVSEPGHLNYIFTLNPESLHMKQKEIPAEVAAPEVKSEVVVAAKPSMAPLDTADMPALEPAPGVKPWAGDDEIDQLPPEKMKLPATAAGLEKMRRKEIRAALKKHAGMPVVEDRFFTVQLESLPAMAEATYKAALWQELGFRAWVCSAELSGKGSWYRIRVGQFPTRADAEKILRKVTVEDKNLKPVVVEEKGLCPRLASSTPWEDPLSTL